MEEKPGIHHKYFSQPISEGCKSLEKQASPKTIPIDISSDPIKRISQKKDYAAWTVGEMASYMDSL
jgi:hypothetical protein